MSQIILVLQIKSVLLRCSRLLRGGLHVPSLSKSLLMQALTEMDMFNAKKDKLESIKRGHITLEDAPDK